MKLHRLASLCSAALVVLCAAAGPASAEPNEITIAKQYGIAYLPLMIMQQENLVEKHARAAGLGDLKVNWATFAGSNVANDALLSGNLQFAAVGVPPLITMWAKTRGNLDVKAVAAINSMPFYLTTRNPGIKSIKDFTETDKIALPAAKVSIQAVTLQMAAEKAFGPGNAQKLDALTVSMSHPDAMAALLSGSSGINSHFTSPPFQYQELEKPGIRKVLSSYDVLGGATTFVVVWATNRFREANPKTYASFYKALEESMDMINRDRKRAAEIYLAISKSKEPVEAILKMLNDPEIEFTMTPKNTLKYADFLHRIGSVKVKPDSWKDLFMPEAHGLPGS